VVIFGDFFGFFRFIKQQICDVMLFYRNGEISPQKIKKHCLQASLFKHKIKLSLLIFLPIW
jgi:hypothetical protein